MRIYSKQNVKEAALDRIRYLFDEFPNVLLCFSGGKDSTVVLHLALQVARELGRLPVRVLWIDQEAEWQGTADYVESVMTRPDVDPLWLQMPMVITNNASSYERFNHCWQEGKEEEWIRPKHPIAKKSNPYGEERFHALFGAIMQGEYPEEKVCTIGGVRCEESPARTLGLTSGVTYKHITWGKVRDRRRGHYDFYPIYDWSYTDVWKFIHEERVGYNRIYDELYRYGVPVRDMRISNLHHETSVKTLLLVQEIEPKTWERIAARIAGANSIKHLKQGSFKCPAEHPPMFRNWQEYAEHLIRHIVQEQEHRDLMHRTIHDFERYMINDTVRAAFYTCLINTVLSSDWDLTKIGNFKASPNFSTLRKFLDGKITEENYRKSKSYNKFIQL